MNKLRKIRPINVRYVSSPVFFIYFFFFFQQDRGRKISLPFWRWKAEVLERYLFCNSLNIFEARLVKISIVCCRKWTNCGRSVLRYVLSPVFFIYLFIYFFLIGSMKDDHPFDDEKLRFCKDIYFAIFSKLDW